MDPIDGEEKHPQAPQKGVKEGVSPRGHPGHDQVDHHQEAQQGAEKPPKPLAPAQEGGEKGEEEEEAHKPGHPVGFGHVKPPPLLVKDHPHPRPKAPAVGGEEGLLYPALDLHPGHALRVQGQDAPQEVAPRLLG